MSATLAQRNRILQTLSRWGVSINWDMLTTLSVEDASSMIQRIDRAVTRTMEQHTDPMTGKCNDFHKRNNDIKVALQAIIKQ